jgi:hypothetical protein
MHILSYAYPVSRKYTCYNMVLRNTPRMGVFIHSAEYRSSTDYVWKDFHYKPFKNTSFNDRILNSARQAFA